MVEKISYKLSKDKGVAIYPLEDGYGVYCAKNADLNLLQEIQTLNGSFKQIDWFEPEIFADKLGELHTSEQDNTEELMANLTDDVDLQSLMEELPQAQDLMEEEQQAPVIRLINGIFSEALRQGASDIHIETFEKYLLVRLRVDGTLREILRPPRVLASMLVSRIKVISNLDIAEKRQPQDGRITIKSGGREVDIRVSTLPGVYGERVVMRLLDKKAALLSLEQLGMQEEVFKKYSRLLKEPNGIILATGPTGSGKTTSLYASLSTVNDRSRNILTVEDPVEYALDGVGQTPVNPKAGMTFARGLRAILRQDPDIVMIGEIRDLETATIAVQASLTGHLVLSTLHTNSALGAITRLRDMGIESFLLSSSLKGVVAQRLVRKLCDACKKEDAPREAEIEILTSSKLSNKSRVKTQKIDKVYRPVGCPACQFGGYKGRVGLYELVVIDNKLADLIHKNAGEMQMAEYAFSELPTLLECGIDEVIKGNTSVEEVMRVVEN